MDTSSAQSLALHQVNECRCLCRITPNYFVVHAGREEAEPPVGSVSWIYTTVQYSVIL